MPDKSFDNDVNRRGFLKAAMVTAVVATTTGTAGALLLRKQEPTPVSIPSISSNVLPESIDGSLEFSELRSLLAASQAENTRLQIRLNAIESQLALARRMNENDDNATLAWQAQLEESSNQVGVLSEEVGPLRGLVDLYEELESVDLAAIIGGGLVSVGGVLGDIVDEVPMVSEGLMAGQKALDELEEQIPRVEDGRRWLSGQIETITRAHEAIERTLRNSVKVTGSFLQMFNEWIQDVLKWLPFGIGDKAAAIMDAIAGLLAQVPDTISGLQSEIIDPLDLWLAQEDGEPRLQRRLIKPVREKALDQASQTVSRVETLQNIFETNLVEPVSQASGRQQDIRSSISEYRQKHQL